MKRISVLVLLVLLSCSSPALAARHHRKIEIYSANPFIRAVEVAVVYWGRSVPCRRLPVVRLSTPPPITEVSAGPLQGALAKGMVEVEAWVNLPEAVMGQCTIFLNNNRWNSRLMAILEFHKLCNMVTHEIGHFLGHEDEGATNAASITYPEETTQNESSVPECIDEQYDHSTISKIADRILQEEKRIATGKLLN